MLVIEVVVVDVETTGLRTGSDDIIELAAVEWLDGVIGESFHSLVRPHAALPRSIAALTGISAAEIASAPTLSDVFPGFLYFLAGRPVAAHNASFDLACLRTACDALGYEWPAPTDALDTLTLSRMLLPSLRDHRLASVAAACDVPVQSTHRALADALLCASALTALRIKTQSLPYLTLSQLERLAALVSPVTAAFFADAATARLASHGTALPQECNSVLQLVFAQTQEGQQETDDGTAVETPNSSATGEEEDLVRQARVFLSATGSVAALMPGFQSRPAQQRMVEAVAQAMNDGAHLIAEAGTGTGKSLAYLAPAMFHAAAGRGRVVVSTETVALQDQIESRDFPTLRSAARKPVRLAVFKGRTHYLCLRKLHQEVNSLGFGVPKTEIESYMTLLAWLPTTTGGTREEVVRSRQLNDIWPRVQSETESCINKRCPFFRSCYYFRARARAFEADVVVTNHSLLLSDLKTDHRVLPHYEHVVIDEAHHLEEEATRHLGAVAEWWRLRASMARLQRDGGRHGVVPELISRLDEAPSTAAVMALSSLRLLEQELPSLSLLLESAFSSLGQLITPGQGECRITPVVRSELAWQSYLDTVLRLETELPHLREVAETLQKAGEDEAEAAVSGRLYDAAGFLRDLLASVAVLGQAVAADDDWVVWVERSGIPDRPQWSLHVAPIDVAPLLRNLLFDDTRSAILTSATLSVAGNFDFFKHRLGLDYSGGDGRDVRELSVPSPFDYARQALLCVPSDMPDLARSNTPEAAIWLAAALYRLAAATQGRMLALFTNHALLRATAERCRSDLAAIDLQLLAQGLDGDRSHLLDTFRQNQASVLFGAQSFWEGIDLPGEQLTALAIVRLPFSPPSHPVTAARYERLEQSGQNSFRAASLPEAVVRFRQGFGRLIRTMDDRGVVVVYDRRIIQAAYGRTFMRSLGSVRPFIGPEATVIERVQNFLSERE